MLRHTWIDLDIRSVFVAKPYEEVIRGRNKLKKQKNWKKKQKTSKFQSGILTLMNSSVLHTKKNKLRKECKCQSAKLY